MILADYEAGPYTTNHRAALYRDRCGKPTVSSYTVSSKLKRTPYTWPSHSSDTKWEPQNQWKPYTKKWEQAPTSKPWTTKWEQPHPKTWGCPQKSAKPMGGKWAWIPSSTRDKDDWETYDNTTKHKWGQGANQDKDPNYGHGKSKKRCHFDEEGQWHGRNKGEKRRKPKP